MSTRQQSVKSLIGGVSGGKTERVPGDISNFAEVVFYSPGIPL